MWRRRDTLVRTQTDTEIFLLPGGQVFVLKGEQLVSVRKVNMLSGCCNVMGSESMGKLERERAGETGHTPAYVWREQRETRRAPFSLCH